MIEVDVAVDVVGLVEVVVVAVEDSAVVIAVDAVDEVEAVAHPVVVPEGADEEPPAVEPEDVEVLVLAAATRSSSSHIVMPVCSSRTARRICW